MKHNKVFLVRDFSLTYGGSATPFFIIAFLYYLFSKTFKSMTCLLKLWCL